MYRVLLADDEQIERVALAKCLKRHFGSSLDISEVVNGAEALETFRRGKSQTVVMDMSMPEMNGVEAAEHIHSLDEDCTIIFLTAYDEFSYAKRATVIRTLDYLLKPYEKEELVAVMEEAMWLIDRRLAGQGASGLDSPDPYITGLDVHADESTQAMSRDDGDGRLAQVAETIWGYIRNNYIKEIFIQDAARMTNYSDAYSCKLFKQCFDQNLTPYLIGFRVNEAEKLLRDRSISVKDVSMQVGYHDSNYFAKVLRRITGMIPSEYRDSEIAQKQRKVFVHLCEGNQEKMGEDKIFFLYDKLLRYKIKAPGYITKKMLRRRQKVLTFSD